MASAGWQGQKDFQTSRYPHMAMNLNVWNVSHSGTTLTFSAVVRSIVTSGSINYDGCSVSLTGGGSKSINMHKSTGGYVDTGEFTCTVTGVPAGANTYNITASFSAGSVASGSASWALDIGATGNPPSGAGVTFISSTWNSVTSNNTVADWGSWSNCFYAAVLVTGNVNGEVDNMPDAQWTQWSRWHTIVESDGGDSKILTVSPTATGLGHIGSPVPLKGMLHYKLVSGPYNDYGNASAIDSTLRYLQPAAPQFSYTDPGTIGAKTYPVTFTGDLLNNNTTYNTANLTRYVRYKIDNGNWTVVENNTNKALDAVTSFNVTVPAGSVATIEGYMTYHGMRSDTATITISNTNIGCALYGSVGGEAKQLDTVYASVNGQAKKLVKIYASVGGVAKKVYEDV